jgi:dTDP-4-dehydrorhamnose 3,5-epimerase
VRVCAGFCTRKPNTEVVYKADIYYAPEYDAGLVWDDAGLGMDWPIPAREAVLSEKDRQLPVG